MYTTMDNEEFDPVSHFKQDDGHHCFLIFKKVDNDSIPTVAPNLAPSLVPAPAAAPPPAPEPAPASAARMIVINPSPIPEVQAAMTGRNFQLRTLLRNGVRAPKVTNGGEICMSYHAVNRCFSDCAHRSTHRPLVGNESIVFCTFIQENVVTPDIGRS